MTQGLEALLPRLDRLGLAAKRDKSLQFNNLVALPYCGCLSRKG